MRNWGARRSSTLRTEIRSVPARKPKEDASGEAPSRIRMVPRSTRWDQSASADAAAAGITSTSPAAAACKPIEERIAGHPPGSPPATWNVRVAAAQGSPARSRLVRKRIPDADPDIVEVGTVGVGLVHQVSPAQEVHGELQGIQAKPDAGPGLHRIGPILALGVNRSVPVPIKLNAFAEPAASAILRI